MLFIVNNLSFIHTAHLIFFELQPMLQVFLYVESVSLIEVRCELVIRMFRDVVLIREERTNTAKLEDAFAAIQDSKLIHTHKLLAELLIVKAVRYLAAPALACVEGVDCLFAQGSCQLFECGRLLAAQEDGAVHITYDGVRVILVQRFELTLCLQNEAAGDLTAADRGDQLFQPGDLSDVGRLIDQAADVNRQASAVHIIRFLAQQIEKLGIAERNEEVEGIVGIGHDDKQRRLPVAQSIKLKLIISGQIAQLLNIKGSKASSAGDQDAFCCLAQDKMSRTF